MTRSIGRTLEKIVGTLAQTFSQLERSTIQHGAQITNDRMTAKEPLRTELRNASF